MYYYVYAFLACIVVGIHIFSMKMMSLKKQWFYCKTSPEQPSNQATMLEQRIRGLDFKHSYGKTSPQQPSNPATGQPSNHAGATYSESGSATLAL